MSVEECRPELTHPDFLLDQPAALQEVAWVAAPFADTYLLRPWIPSSPIKWIMVGGRIQRT